MLTLSHFVPRSEASGCDEFTDLDLHHAFIGTTLEVRLLLYTRDHSTCGQELSHHNLTAQPRFNLSRPTTLIIHGYRPSGSPPVWLSDLTQQLLATADMNILVVDWNSGAANFNYLKAVENTRVAADNITGFIRRMQVTSRRRGSSSRGVDENKMSLGPNGFSFLCRFVPCILVVSNVLARENDFTCLIADPRGLSEHHPHGRRQPRGPHVGLRGS